MKVSKKEKGPGVLEVSVELDAAELNAYVEQAANGIAANVVVPGFRKGKAPKERTRHTLDDSRVREKALQQALEESFARAAKDEQWDIAGTVNLQIGRNDEKGLLYSVTVQLWPPVHLPDLSTIQVPRKPVVVSEDEIREALETVRGLRATFLDKDSPAEKEDRVEVDFDASVDEKPVEGGSSRNHPLIIGGKSFLPGFEDELIGLSVGEKKNFSITAPSDYYEPKMAGKSVQFQVTMRRVQRVLKPELNDDFAKGLGGFENLAGLRAKISDGIRQEKEEKERQRLRLEILDTIAKTANPPVPDHVIDRELESMVARFRQDLQGRGLDLSMYLARLNTTEEKIKEGWRDDARRQARIALVLHQLAKDKDIHAHPDEIEATLQAAVAELAKEGQTPERIDMERLRAVIVERIIRDRLLAMVERECAVSVS